MWCAVGIATFWLMIKFWTLSFLIVLMLSVMLPFSRSFNNMFLRDPKKLIRYKKFLFNPSIIPLLPKVSVGLRAFSTKSTPTPPSRQKKPTKTNHSKLPVSQPPAPTKKSYEFETMSEKEYSFALKDVSKQYRHQPTKIAEFINQYRRHHSDFSLSMVSDTLKCLYYCDCAENNLIEIYNLWYKDNLDNAGFLLLQQPNITSSIIHTFCAAGQVQFAVNNITQHLNHELFQLPTNQQMKQASQTITNTTNDTTLSDQIPAKLALNAEYLLFAYHFYQNILLQLALGYTEIHQYSKMKAIFHQMCYLKDMIERYHQQLSVSGSNNSISRNEWLYRISIEPMKLLMKNILKSTSTTPSSSPSSLALSSTAIPIVSKEMLDILTFIQHIDSHALQHQDILQLFIGTYFPSIQFVKGAVSLRTLPTCYLQEKKKLLQDDDEDDDKDSKVQDDQIEEDDFMLEATNNTNSSNSNSQQKKIIPEFIFIGRSNVGKSSLINMITNRKQLAYTSKTAGKTTEFNYFYISSKLPPIINGKKKKQHANDDVDDQEEETHNVVKKQMVRGKEGLDLYLVDLPGVGYAQRSQSLISSWVKLFHHYVKTRFSLQTIFHLIDSRHGLLDADYDCFSVLSFLPPNVQYVIVLTKIDKQYSNIEKHYKYPNPQEELKSFVKPTILTHLETELQKHTKREIPIFFTSSLTKEGGMDLIQHILSSVVNCEKKK